MLQVTQSEEVVKIYDISGFRHTVKEDHERNKERL